MLCRTSELTDWVVAARDGEIGKVRDVFFDDDRWVIRHLVVDTGGWLRGRRVLVSPHSVERIDPEGGRVVVALSRQQIEDAPGVDSDRPLSRQQEIAQYDYYGYPYYWTGMGLWGASALPIPYAGAGRAAGIMGAAAPDTGAARDARQASRGDPHLRSAAEVQGYHIAARDDSIGHVDDFVFDPQSWEIRHMVVDTRNWLPGRHVLVDPPAIESVDWAQREVRVRLTRAEVKEAPAADHAHA